MIDWIQELKNYESTPQYSKSLDIVIDLNKIRDALHFKIDNKLKKALKLNDFTFKRILAGDNDVPIKEYNKVLNYLNNFMKKIN